MNPTTPTTPFNSPSGEIPAIAARTEMTAIDIIHEEARDMLGKENIAIYHGHVEAAKAYRLCREALQKLLEEQESK